MSEQGQASDLAALSDRVQKELSEWRSSATVNTVEPLLGGESSLTYVVRLNGCEIESAVIKMAVPGVPPTGNRDVLRQARIMLALRNEAVPVPEVLFQSLGVPPEAPPLFAMTHVAGVSFEPHIDEIEVLPRPETVRKRAFVAAENLASLHLVNVDGALADNAPILALDEEVLRWTRALASVDPVMSAGYSEASDKLLACLPQEVAPTLLHGDYRLGNLLFEGTTLNATIDWEIWGRGDPRVDLGWFLMTAEPEMHPSAIRQCPGMPEPSELLRAYEAARGCEIAGMDWFRAFTLFKFAAVVALIVKHRLKVGSEDELTRRLGPRIPAMLASTAETVGSLR